MKKRILLLFVLAVTLIAVTAYAQAPSGAIFTTDRDGDEVNLNQYPAKEDVYLDGGPGPGAPISAAGLDAGIYVFQVTDPSGKVLLSTDIARCRQFTISGDGIIVDVAPSGGCAHNTGIDMDHNALTVQLMPYDDTPNNGGVYKVWVTLQEDYLAGCAIQGVANGLDVVDCGPLRRSGGIAHGFIPSESKTDNYKVKSGLPREIDCRFRSPKGTWMDGLEVLWIDTVGASNRKWSVWAPELLAYHEAHVENAETGNHRFQIYDQAGCIVQQVYVNGVLMPQLGPQTVDVLVKPSFKSGTLRVDVYCK